MAPAAALGPYNPSEAAGRLLLRQLESSGLYQGERFLGCRPLAASSSFLLLTRRCTLCSPARPGLGTQIWDWGNNQQIRHES